MPWWRQAAAEKNLKFTVEEFFWRKECGGDGNTAGVARAREGRRGGARTMEGRGEARKVVMMGRRQVTPGWADDPVRRYDGS